MGNENTKSAGKYAVGIPSIVIGVLVALKHIGMTNLSYWSIVLFGLEVWLVCFAIAFVLFMVFTLITMIFSK